MRAHAGAVIIWLLLAGFAFPEKFIWPTEMVPVRINGQIVPTIWKDGIPYVDRDKVKHLLHVRSGEGYLNLAETLEKQGFTCELDSDGSVKAYKYEANLSRSSPPRSSGVTGRWLHIGSTSSSEIFIDLDSVVWLGPDRVQVIERHDNGISGLVPQATVYSRDKTFQGVNYWLLPGGATDLRKNPPKRMSIPRGSVAESIWEYFFNQ